jgi:aryl-alcohol dehydrogenase-like predicted oxidoreductase
VRQNPREDYTQPNSSSEGKIKHIGLCGVSSATLRRAVKVAPIACVQTEYSPFVRNIESEAGKNLLQTCRELGVALVASSPLSRGLLTARFASTADLGGDRDIREKQMPRFHTENIETNAKIAQEFENIAKKRGWTSSQLALAWILAQGKDIFVIPGTIKTKYMEENFSAAHLELSEEDEKEVRDFVTAAELKGDSETAAGMMFAFVDTEAE